MQPNGITTPDPADVGRFLDALPLRRGLCFGSAHKLRGPIRRREDDHDDRPRFSRFHWERHRAFRQSVDAAAASMRSYEGAEPVDWSHVTETWEPLELVVSPLAASERPPPEHPANGVDQMTHVLAVWADIDIRERRSDGVDYVPTMAHAVDRLDVCTTLIDTGGGVAGLIVLDEPAPLDDAVRLLRADLIEHVRRRCLPYEFDSPPSWGWVKCPGSWSRWRDCPVSLVRCDAPVTFAEARRRVPRYAHHVSTSRPYEPEGEPWGPPLPLSLLDRAEQRAARRDRPRSLPGGFRPVADPFKRKADHEFRQH